MEVREGIEWGKQVQNIVYKIPKILKKEKKSQCYVVREEGVDYLRIGRKGGNNQNALYKILQLIDPTSYLTS